MAQMPEADKKFLEEIEYYRDKYFTYDAPIPFEGVTIYPITVKNYQEFLSCSACLLLNKNDDPLGVTMTHLDYLYAKLTDKTEGPLWSARFSHIIELCLHIKNGFKCNKCGKFMSTEEYYTKIQLLQKEKEETKSPITDEDVYKIFQCDCEEKGTFIQTVGYKKDAETHNKGVLLLDGHQIDAKSYNKMRKIILYQNLPDFKDDSWVDKSVRDDQAAKAELTSRGQGKATLERKIIGVCAQTSYKIDEIYDLSTRKFLQLLSMIDDIINYTTTKQGIISGMVSLKKGTQIDHWLYKKETGMYDKAVDADSYTSQIKNA